VRIVLMIVLTC